MNVSIIIYRIDRITCTLLEKLRQVSDDDERDVIVLIVLKCYLRNFLTVPKMTQSYLQFK